MFDTIAWTNGELSLQFTGCPISYPVWLALPGIYMICRLGSTGFYIPLYIGQADDLRDRLTQHEQWRPALERGASSVLTAVVFSKTDRNLFERRLIQEFQPPLNHNLKAHPWSLY